jgi:hypothetical protein
LWASRDVNTDIITISKPFYKMTDTLRAALQDAAREGIVVVYNIFDNSDTLEAADGKRTYYFQGDKSVEGILQYMGYSPQTSAAIIGSTLGSGMASLILSHHHTKGGPRQSMRQLVRERFDKLAEAGDGALANNGQRMPWTLSKSTSVGGSQEGFHLRFMLY